MTADAAKLFPGHQTRSASFENPSAAPSSGGLAGGQRKGAPSKVLDPGEKVVLADLTGPGVVTHIWITMQGEKLKTSPALRRSQRLRAFYENLEDPSIDVPACDFFGAVHGMPASYASRLTAINERGGYASRVPMPFGKRLQVEWVNESAERLILYYQVDALMGPLPQDVGYLHCAFNRDNPTKLKRDFVLAQGSGGPGRFLGWTGGVRVLDSDRWWGEGEVKFYFDGEATPTVCGTGTEDYLDSAWGLGTFSAPETGAPMVLVDKKDRPERHRYVSFYRWHLSDPVVFGDSFKATIQQIGGAMFADKTEFEAFKDANRAAGSGWMEGDIIPGIVGGGLYERSDDWCGTSFIYLSAARPIASYSTALAAADLPSGFADLDFVHR